jgi:hypothetical protein
MWEISPQISSQMSKLSSIPESKFSFNSEAVTRIQADRKNRNMNLLFILSSKIHKYSLIYNNLTFCYLSVIHEMCPYR